MGGNLQNQENNQSGYTMIELLTVVGIIGVLAIIAIPEFSTYQDRGFEARVKSDLRTVAAAEEAYFVDNEVFRSCTNNACVTNLPSVARLSDGVQVQMTATATGFTGAATHPQLSTTCRWDSSQAGFLGCS